MPGYVKQICAFLFFVSIAVGVKAQRSQEYRQLTEADFVGAVPPGSGFYIAHTSCNVTMRYDVQRSRGNYQLGFNISLVFNPQRSWINRKMITDENMMAEVLHHEQGHFLIAFLMQQEMIRELNAFRYTGDYQRQTNAIFNRIDDKYRRMNADYDSDTQHMQNRKQQAAWTTFLDKELTRMNALAMAENGY
jgi:predicted secreted Zn-dependent protease